MKWTTLLRKTATTTPCRPRNNTMGQAFLRLPYSPGKLHPVQQGIAHGLMTGGLKTNTEVVIGFLNEALGTAILCILRYKRHAFVSTGIRTRRMKAALLQHVAEEQAHANHLAERIEQLGGKALLPFERLLYQSYAEPAKNDASGKMVTAYLLDTRSAIYSYRAMIASIGIDDPITSQILERILAQKEAHAEILASLQRDCSS